MHAYVQQPMQVKKKKIPSSKCAGLLHSFFMPAKKKDWASHGHEGAGLLIFGLPPGCSLIVLKVGSMRAPPFVHFLLLSICTAILDVHFENTLTIIWFFFKITFERSS